MAGSLKAMCYSKVYLYYAYLYGLCFNKISTVLSILSESSRLFGEAKQTVDSFIHIASGITANF